jgi:pimeloyl-ACP methyl ester carboxylesterase
MTRKLLLLLLLSVFLLSCTAAKNKSTNPVFLNKKAEQKYLSAYNNTMKLWPVPFEEKDIVTTFGNAHVIISGPVNGEPLVLLHGMDASSTMWYPNIKDYTKKYRVYAVDYLMEAGKSVSNDGKFATTDIVSWYNQIFDALNVKKFSVIGTSRGGWIATHYALNCNGRIQKLVLLAPVQTFSGITMQSKTITAANFKFFPSRRRLDKIVHYFSENPGNVSPEFKEQMYLGAKNTKTKLDLLQMTPFSEEELKSIHIPVLVLVGNSDILNKPDIVATATHLLPNITTAVIEDAGHFLTIDKKEEVDKRVLDFLREN